MAATPFAPELSAGATMPATRTIHWPSTADFAGLPRSNYTELRSTIVRVAEYCLRIAGSRTPAEMAAVIWQPDNACSECDGESCAEFAILTRSLAAQLVRKPSWMTCEPSDMVALNSGADVRPEDSNPAWLGASSILRDAEARHRWHPLGDAYRPLPGDWVLFDGHVEVLTSYLGGILHTIGSNSLMNFSIKAHQYHDPLAAHDVTGFVNNGDLLSSALPLRVSPAASGQAIKHIVAAAANPARKPQVNREDPPGRLSAATNDGQSPSQAQRRYARTSPYARSRGRVSPRATAGARFPGPGSSGPVIKPQTTTAGTAAIPEMPAMPPSAVSSAPPRTAAYRRPVAVPVPAPPPRTAAYGISAVAVPARAPRGRNAERSFIAAVAPGAMAAQDKYGIPASVTIAQAIDESGWGRSALAIKDRNLFAISGTGPAGTDMQRVAQYVNGQQSVVTMPFRVYHDIAESIDDHGRLLAYSEYYAPAMAQRGNPDAFANALTGVYATNPAYGAELIALMRRHDLYRYDGPGSSRRADRGRAAAVRTAAIPWPTAAIPGVPSPSSSPQPAQASASGLPHVPHPTLRAGSRGRGHGPAEHQVRQRHGHPLNTGQSPQARADQLAQLGLTFVVLPVLTSIASSFIYDRLKSFRRDGHRATFQFCILRDGGSVVKGQLEADDDAALRRAINALGQLVDARKLHEWDDAAQEWRAIRGSNAPRAPRDLVPACTDLVRKGVVPMVVLSL